MTRASWTAVVLAILLLAMAAIGWLVWQGRGKPPISSPSVGSSVVLARGTPELPVDLESNRADRADKLVSALEVPSAENSGPVAPSVETALVRIHVVEEDGTPVAGAHVSLGLSGEGWWRLVTSSETGSDGRCDLHAKPEQVYRLDVRLENRDLDSRRVPAMAEGHVLEVEVVVSTAVVHGQLDLDFIGIVVNDATNEPIVGASIRGEGDRGDVEVSTGAFGLFTLRVASWEDALASVSASGYARRYFRLGDDHETQVDALTIRLSRAATLQVAVVDAAGTALPRARVSVTTKSDNVLQREGVSEIPIACDDPIWATIADESGVATLNGLPPGVPLGVSAFQGRLARKFPQALKLEAGEVRSLEMSLDAGALIRGSLIDTAGKLISAREIWCLPAEGRSPGMVKPWQEDAVRGRAWTDNEGKFEVHDIPAGTWWLAPAPRDAQRQDIADDGVPSLAQVVMVDPATPIVEVILRVERGAYMGGRVVTPLGQPAEGVWVLAHSVVGSDSSASADSDAEGSFLVGPLPAGRYQVYASKSAGYADSLSVEAEAGAADLVLKLREGGRLHGFVVDAATGEHLEAETQYTRTDCEESYRVYGLAESGEFDIDGLVPGIYSIGAKSRNGQFGYQTGVIVRPGVEIADLPLVVSKGGTLRLHHDGPEGKARYLVFVHDLYLAEGSIDTGETSEIAVPAERISVITRVMGTEREEIKEIQVSPGSIVDVRFGKAQ
jgi:protocatechuate 3,4-dioxygenase beta subunit